MKKLCMLGVCAALATATVSAVPYKVGTGSLVTANTGSGLLIQTALNPGLSGLTFNLADGESKTFDFFTIWTPETTVNADDKVAKAITAYLDFDLPSTGGPTVTGNTVGQTALWGVVQWGKVTWGGPAVVALGDVVIAVSLTDAVFSPGLFGLTPGECFGATVKATVTQRSSVTNVPDGGSALALMGLALMGLGTFRRYVK